MPEPVGAGRADRGAQAFARPGCRANERGLRLSLDGEEAILFKASQGDLLPRERPHGLKYRLYLGRAGKSLVRHDNETGKGDHRHVGPSEKEMPYRFSTVEELLSDFRRDCAWYGWRWDQ